MTAQVTDRARRWAYTGDILITFGVILSLFLTWYLAVGDVTQLAEKKHEAVTVTEEWAAKPLEYSETPTVLPSAEGEVFGVLRIPRFGSDYQVPLIEGASTVNLRDGAARYSDTAMPGQVGNFAVAGHRVTYGGPFRNLHELKTGDAIVVETKEGWFTYRYGTEEIVKPSATHVLEPVPTNPGVQAVSPTITLTTCHPWYSTRERLIVYGTYEGFTGRGAEGQLPPSLTEELT